jgi:hypothetical protein
MEKGFRLALEFAREALDAARALCGSGARVGRKRMEVNIMKRAMVAAAVVGCTASQARAAERLVIAEDGKSDFRIVISANASPSENHAAAELQHFLKEISGAELPVAADTEAMGEHEILVGDSEHLRRLNQAIDWQALGNEGFVMRTFGGHLILAGGRLRGSMYAVYSFLEDVLGCRWFTAKVSRIPKMQRVEVGPLNITHVPVLEYREPFWVEGFDADWAARNRMNSSAARLDETRGGKVTYVGFVHTFYPLLPPEKYFKEHPEYYSEINGKRTADHAQLCLTNREVLRLVAEHVKQWLRENPQAQIVSVSQNDWGGWCECANCKALDDREGSHAGTVLNFVNQVAEIVEKEFPNAAVDTLAYQYTRKPPKTIRPRPNVIVRLCSIECCFSHPLAACPENRTFKQDLEGWSKVAKRLYVWDYTTNFSHYIMPHPNLRVLKPNIQLYVKNNVRGIFEQGNYQGGGGGEFSTLRAYMLAKFLWNPEYDERQAMREFLEGFYGKAARPIERYIKLMHDKVEKDRIHCRIFGGATLPHLSMPMIERAKKLFDEAERAADNEEIRERVRLARLPIQYVEILHNTPIYRVVGESYKPGRVAGRAALVRKFFEVAERSGITNISEGTSLADYKKRLEEASQAWPVAKLENRRVRVHVVPGLGGRIISIFDKQARAEILRQPDPTDGAYPRCAGYEEYSGSGYRTPGWKEKYEYRVEEPGARVVMTAQLENGLTFQRTVSIGDDGAVSINSILANTSSEPKVARLRVHPEFFIGPIEQVEVSFRTALGRRRRISLRPRAEKDEWTRMLEANSMPAGQWTAVNLKKGWGVEQTFDPAQVERVRLNWNRNGRFNLELFSPEKTLAPGESITIAHTCKPVKASPAR